MTVIAGEKLFMYDLIYINDDGLAMKYKNGDPIKQIMKQVTKNVEKGEIVDFIDEIKKMNIEILKKIKRSSEEVS